MNRIPPQFTKGFVATADTPTPDYEPILLDNIFASEKTLEKRKQEKILSKISSLKVEVLQRVASSFMGNDLHKQPTSFIFLPDQKNEKKKRAVYFPFSSTNSPSLTGSVNSDLDMENRKTVLLQGEQKSSSNNDSHLLLKHQQSISILHTSPPENLTTAIEKTSHTHTKETSRISTLALYSIFFGLFALGFLLIVLANRQNSQLFTFLGFLISLLPIICLYYFYYFSKNRKS